MNSDLVNATSQNAPNQVLDGARVQQAFSTFAGRVAHCDDVRVKNAVEQLRRDLKRAKINSDNLIGPPALS